MPVTVPAPVFKTMTTPPTANAPRPLQKMFDAVPPRYDLINHIMTLGMDTGWRRRTARTCLEENPGRVLDLGCGTGDLAITIARYAGKETEVTGLDFSEFMLDKARAKAAAAGVGITFVEGDATSIPFPDGYFDCVGIAFAFRNLTYRNPLREPHFAEVLRVLKPGGRYVAVESSQPRQAFVRAVMRGYLYGFVRPLGWLVSGNRGAYTYLTSSVAHYFMPDEVRDLFLQAGFSSVRYQELFFGAAGIHVATK